MVVVLISLHLLIIDVKSEDGLLYSTKMKITLSAQKLYQIAYDVNYDTFFKI